MAQCLLNCDGVQPKSLPEETPMKSLESLWYEVSPYVFVILGVTTALFTNRTGALFGALLMIVASWILTMRWSYRSGMRVSVAEYRERNRSLARR